MILGGERERDYCMNMVELVNHPGEIKVEVASDTHLVSTTKLKVLGICCAGEIPTIRNILEPLPGVENVSVNFTTRTVSVVHNPQLTPSTQLTKSLNEARMKASLYYEVNEERNYYGLQITIAGVLLLISFFNTLISPLKWFALGAVLIGIPGISLKAIASLKRLTLDINVLMLIAVLGATFLGNYTEAGSIVVLFSLADWLQINSVRKASQALSFAANLVPQCATIAETGTIVPVSEIELGMVISVKAGEMIPVDGVIISGHASIEESSLTGESRPVSKSINDSVWAGTINLTGYILIRTTSTAEDSTISRMIKLVEEAQSKRSRTELSVETFAKYYTPVVFSGALTTALVPYLLHARDKEKWIYLSLIIVVAACPCALVISTPVTVTCAIAKAAKSGVIIKGGDCLEALCKLKVVAFDKTGTLTEGHFRVLNFEVVDPCINKQELIQWIAGVESLSSHPIATACMEYAREVHVKPSDDVINFNTMEGQGVSAIVDGHFLEIGNARLALIRNWNHGVEDSGASVCWVGVDGKLAGIFTAADKLRENSHEAIQKLKGAGIRTVMLTGDNNSAAALVSQQLDGIEFHAQLLPQDKIKVIEDIKSILGTTAMVGDGVNDAPALAAADVGIAMGVAGSALAMETAEIALMSNDLRKLPMVYSLAQTYRKVVQQNIFLSLFTKLVVMVLALIGYAPLWAAVLSDVGTCLLVTLNGMHLLFNGSYSAAKADVKQVSQSCLCCSKAGVHDLEVPLLDV